MHAGLSFSQSLPSFFGIIWSKQTQRTGTKKNRSEWWVGNVNSIEELSLRVVVLLIPPCVAVFCLLYGFMMDGWIDGWTELVGNQASKQCEHSA